MLKTIRYAFLLLIVAGPVRAETLADLIQDTRVLVVDSGTANRVRYSDEQIRNLLNVAQHQAIAATQCLVLSTTFTLTVGVTYYQMPSNYISMARVWKANYGTLSEVSPAALDGKTRGWQSAGGTPLYYFINFATRTYVGFAPFPVVGSDTATVTAEYYAQATDLTNATDVPYNGVVEMQDYQHGLTYYAASVLSAINGFSAQSKAFWDISQNTLASMKTQCRARPSYNPSATASP